MELKSDKKWQWTGALASFMITSEGLIAVAMAGKADIQGIGGISKSTVELAGMQLAALGFISLALLRLAIFDPVIIKDRRISLLIALTTLVCGVIISVEGAVLALVGGSISIDGFGTLPAYAVGIIAAQVFFLGMVITLAMMQLAKPFNWQKAVNQGASVAVAADGLMVICITIPTAHHSLARILGTTVDMAGIELFVLGCGLIGTIAWRALFPRFDRSAELVSALLALIVLGCGMALVFSDSTANFKELMFRPIIITVAGVQLATLAILINLTNSSSNVVHWQTVRFISLRVGIGGLLLLPLMVLAAKMIA